MRAVVVNEMLTGGIAALSELLSALRWRPNELQAVFDGVRRDDEFMGLLRDLVVRDAEILERLAVG